MVVQLKNWRIGRIGTVLSKEIEDQEWNPSVPTQGGDSGEMGRRVLVRWDLATGRLPPASIDFVFSVSFIGPLYFSAFLLAPQLSQRFSVVRKRDSGSS